MTFSVIFPPTERIAFVRDLCSKYFHIFHQIAFTAREFGDIQVIRNSF